MEVKDIEAGFAFKPVPEGKNFDTYAEFDSGKHVYCKATKKRKTYYWRTKWPDIVADSLESLFEILTCGPCNSCNEKWICPHNDCGY